jgi:hypothetical protein
LPQLTQETTWKYPITSLNIPILLYWDGNILYAALGISSIKILRFPPQPTTLISPSSPKHVQVLKRDIYIPSSSYNRDVQFFIRQDPFPTTPRARRAVFVLDESPKLELPAVSLDFKLEAEDWEDYDPNVVDEDIASLKSSNFLKGAYASKEQAFCVPIRSGLDWRKSVYVTCW